MNKKDIDIICWWIPFKKTRNAVRSILISIHDFLIKDQFDDSLINYKDYWIGDSLNNIIPLNHGENPEGFDPKLVLKDITKKLDFDTVLDFGCGYGRLS